MPRTIVQGVAGVTRTCARAHSCLTFSIGFSSPWRPPLPAIVKRAGRAVNVVTVPGVAPGARPAAAPAAVQSMGFVDAQTMEA